MKFRAFKYWWDKVKLDLSPDWRLIMSESVDLCESLVNVIILILGPLWALLGAFYWWYHAMKNAHLAYHRPDLLESKREHRFWGKYVIPSGKDEQK